MGTCVCLGNYVGRTIDIRNSPPIPISISTHSSNRIKGTLLNSVLVDGVNAYGLVVMSLDFDIYAPRSQESTPHRHSENINLEDDQMVMFLLSHAHSIDDVKEFCRIITIVQSHLHWICFDANKKCIVIECSTKDGFPIVFDNPYGVLTGLPSYPDQLRMVQHPEVMALHPNMDEARAKMQRQSAHYSHGTGLIGLPGDMSSVSRFVRSCTLSQLLSSNSEPSNLSEMFHLLDYMFILPGMDSIVHTAFTVVYDLSKNTYDMFIRDGTSQRITKG